MYIIMQEDVYQKAKAIGEENRDMAIKMATELAKKYRATYRVLQAVSLFEPNLEVTVIRKDFP